MADSDWSDPLDTSYAARSGGRWNPPGSFGVLYLNATTDVACANVVRQLAGQPFGPEDLDPDSAPVLVSVQVPENSYVDAVTARGLRIGSGRDDASTQDIYVRPLRPSGHSPGQQRR